MFVTGFGRLPLLKPHCISLLILCTIHAHICLCLTLCFGVSVYYLNNNHSFPNPLSPSSKSDQLSIPKLPRQTIANDCIVWTSEPNFDSAILIPDEDDEPRRCVQLTNQHKIAIRFIRKVMKHMFQLSTTHNADDKDNVLNELYLVKQSIRIEKTQHAHTHTIPRTRHLDAWLDRHFESGRMFRKFDVDSFRICRRTKCICAFGYTTAVTLAYTHSSSSSSIGYTLFSYSMDLTCNKILKLYFFLAYNTHTHQHTHIHTHKTQNKIHPTVYHSAIRVYFMRLLRFLYLNSVSICLLHL